MFFLLLINAFEAFLFPPNILAEDLHNPACLYHREKIIAVHTEMKYGLSELRTYDLSIRIREYGFRVMSFGGDLYRENEIGFGFGFPILKNLGAGINLSLLHYWIKDHEGDFGYALRVGGLFEFRPLELFAWFNNLNSPHFSTTDYLPLNYSLGCRYYHDDKLCLKLAVRGLELEMPFFNVGIGYTPNRIIELFAGANTEPMILEFGLRILLGRLDLEYAGNNHPQLGLTHGFGARFNL